MLVKLFCFFRRKLDCQNFCPRNTYSDRINSLTLGKPFEHICPNEVVICPGDEYLFYNDSQDYKRRYAPPYDQQLAEQLYYLQSLLEYLKDQHIKVVAIDLPVTQAHRGFLSKGFWGTYPHKIIELCRKGR